MRTMAGWTISEWQDAYRNGESPHELLAVLLDAQDPQDPAWIALASRAVRTGARPASTAR